MLENFTINIVDFIVNASILFGVSVVIFSPPVFILSLIIDAYKEWKEKINKGEINMQITKQQLLEELKVFFEQNSVEEFANKIENCFDIEEIQDFIEELRQ
ncbi:hypothetical protein [Clostridium perfringens]|uniref:hypothetical protein n=1 Tax=Clostridium perfringens TaxID=1502 RepID=UPI0037489BF0